MALNHPHPEPDHTGTQPDRQGRRVEVRVDAPGKVRVETLTTKLMAAQRVLWNVGASLSSGGRRGRLPDEVIQTCTLYFEEAHSGSTVASAVLPERSSLFPEQDLGLTALTRMLETIGAVGRGESAHIARLYPDHGQRARVVNSIRPLAPEEDAEYSVAISTNGTAAVLNSQFRDRLQDVVRLELDVQEQDIRRLTGELYLIEVGTGNLHVGLKTEGRKIPCSYDSAMESEIRDLIPGSLVEVEGMATVNANGDVEHIDRILDIAMVEPIVPLEWTRVDFGNRRYTLREPIRVQQSYEGRMWVCATDTLGILAYGETRHEALMGWRARFAANWDDIAQEEDNAYLTLDAQDLKQRLLRLVDSVTQVQ